MKRIVCSILSLSFLAGIAYAQQPAAGVDSSATAVDAKIEVYLKENIPFKSPVPLAPVREADVIWAKTVWRVVDLRQKQNLPLYFPVAPTREIGGRVNFFHLLLKGVERGEITAYDGFPDGDEFAASQIRTYEQIISNPSLKAEDKEVPGVSVYTGRDTMLIQKGKNVLEDEEVARLFIKEIMYFDRRYSSFKRVVIGIMPMYYFYEEVEGGEPTLRRIPVMWIYYPEARPLLARHSVYNTFNDAQNISFDDFFMQNRYEGLIYKQSNVHNNRAIADYTKGVDALHEAAKIENEIFNWEQDMWEY